MKSDDFCGFNTSASPFFWVLAPYQFVDSFSVGEVGVSSNSNYIRADVIDISSFLSGRNDILTKCLPPVPSLESLNKEYLTGPKPEHLGSESGPLVNQSILIPKYTRQLKSENDISAIDYNQWTPNLPIEPQNLRYVIEGFAPERGGLNTQNFIKSSWANQNNDPNFDRTMCMTNLDPSFVSDPSVSGYPGVDFITGQQKYVTYKAPGKPPGQPNYPFTDITSQQVTSVGAAQCGPNFFYGPNYNQGGPCPTSVPQVFINGQQ